MYFTSNILGSTLQEVDISHNALGSTGVELLLMSLRADTLCRLNITATVHGPSSSNLMKHVERYLKQVRRSFYNELRKLLCHKELSLEKGKPGT